MGNAQVTENPFGDCKDYVPDEEEEKAKKAAAEEDDEESDNDEGKKEEKEEEKVGLDPSAMATKLRKLANMTESSVDSITGYLSKFEFNADLTMKKLLEAQDNPPRQEPGAPEPNPDLCPPFYSGDALAHIAAENGDVDLLVYLFKANVNLSMRNKLGTTPLMRAASMDQLEAAEVLLKYTEEDSVREQNSIGNTPLHLAAACGFDKMCTLLLKHGAGPSLNVQNRLGMTPLLVAKVKAVQDVLIEAASGTDAKDAKDAGGIVKAVTDALVEATSGTDAKDAKDAQGAKDADGVVIHEEDIQPTVATVPTSE